MSGNSSLTYPEALYTEYTVLFEGNALGCVLYGIYIIIAGANLAILRQKGYNVLLAFTIAQLMITTLYLAISLYATPSQSLGIFGIFSTYTPDALSPWPSIVADTTFLVNACASDAFLLYRCYVVCKASKLVIAFPSLLYLASVASAIAWLVVSSVPGAVYSTHAVQVAGIIFWSCSVVMTIYTSFLISLRLWLHRQTIIQVTGSSQGAALYLNYIAITLESAVLYTAFVIIGLVVFTLNSVYENVFFPMLGIIEVIAPALIIFRMVRGISFETDENGSLVVGTQTLVSATASRANPGTVLGLGASGASNTLHVSTADGAKQEVPNPFGHEAKPDV